MYKEHIMTKIFFTVSVCLIVLNILVMLIPEGTYRKYSKLVCGFISVAVVLGIIMGADVDFDFSDRYLSETFSVQEARTIALRQGAKIIEDNVKTQLEEKFGGNFDVYVSDDGSKISKLKVIAPHGNNEEEIIRVILTVCNTERENIIVEYKE